MREVNEFGDLTWRHCARLSALADMGAYIELLIFGVHQREFVSNVQPILNIIKSFRNRYFCLLSTQFQVRMFTPFLRSASQVLHYFLLLA